MARLARLYVQGCAHHLIQRGNNRAACFLQQMDFANYLKYLKESAEKHRVAVHSFVLMTNHVHLLVTPADAHGCPRMMQALGRQYVGYFNKQYCRTGTLWEGRYKSTLVESDRYFFAVSRYIELNPVRACMVANPWEYTWSSYHGNALNKQIGLLSPHPIYTALGSDTESRSANYRTLFEEQLPQEIIKDIRDATNGAWALGSVAFKQTLEQSANRRVESSGWGGDRKSRSLTP